MAVFNEAEGPSLLKVKWRRGLRRCLGSCARVCVSQVCELRMGIMTWRSGQVAKDDQRWTEKLDMGS